MEGGVDDDRLRSLCEALPTGLYLAEREGEMFFANDAFRRVVGDRRISEWIETLPSDMRDEARQRWLECCRDGTPFSLLVAAVSPTGATIWLRWRGLRLG
ncbi:MAG: PAS domain-containing protein, partial [Polyangia bacterium]